MNGASLPPTIMKSHEAEVLEDEGAKADIALEGGGYEAVEVHVSEVDQP